MKRNKVLAIGLSAVLGSQALITNAKALEENNGNAAIEEVDGNFTQKTGVVSNPLNPEDEILNEDKLEGIEDSSTNETNENNKEENNTTEDNKEENDTVENDTVENDTVENDTLNKEVKFENKKDTKNLDLVKNTTIF